MNLDDLKHSISLSTLAALPTNERIHALKLLTEPVQDNESNRLVLVMLYYLSEFIKNVPAIRDEIKILKENL